MLNVQFSGLSFFETDFKKDRMADRFLRPSKLDIVPITAIWNGITYDVQHVIYETFQVEFNFRDSEYNDFQKIQSAPSIKLQENGKTYNCSIVSFDSEPYLSEFWKINIVFRNLDSRTIENKILFEKIGEITITDNVSIVSPKYDINLRSLHYGEFENILIDSFKNDLSDYRKLSKYIKLRFYIERGQLSTFLDQITEVSYLNLDRIIFRGVSFWEYEIEQTEVGYDLIQIELKLIKNKKIIT